MSRLVIEIARKGGWKRIGDLAPSDPAGSLSHNPSEGDRQVIVFACRGDHSLIERSLFGATTCPPAAGCTIDTVGTKQLARLGPGQQFETIVRTDRGATKHVRFRHEGRR